MSYNLRIFKGLVHGVFESFLSMEVLKTGILLIWKILACHCEFDTTANTFDWVKNLQVLGVIEISCNRDSN